MCDAVCAFIVSLYRRSRLRVSHVGQNVAQSCCIAHILEESTQFGFGRGGDHDIEYTASDEEAPIDGSGGDSADLVMLSEKMESRDA